MSDYNFHRRITLILTEAIEPGDPPAVVTCQEFPLVSGYGETLREALHHFADAFASPRGRIRQDLSDARWWPFEN